MGEKVSVNRTAVDPGAREFRDPGDLDQLDRAILDVLMSAARTTNRELAARLGVAESTAHARRRALERRGVIAGYETIVSPSAFGQGLQALVGVTLRPGARQASIVQFSEDTRRLREVTQLFFIGGGDDFVVHVAVADSSALRRFVVEHLSGHERVASTRTNIIFEYTRNAVPASFR